MTIHSGWKKKSRGFSLIELMVGLTVGIIALLVIGGVLQVSGQQKKITASGGDAQTSGALSHYIIERDLRMAGYGFNMADLLACKIHGYDEQKNGGTAFTLMSLPVAISVGASGAPDRLSIQYGSGDVGLFAAKLTSDNGGTNANYKVDNRFGFHEGDLIVVVQPGVDPDADGVDDCVLAQVTGVPGTPGQSDNVIHNSGNYTDPSTGSNVPARYNKPSGLGIAYSKGAKVYNLGKMPTSKTYYIDTATNQLLVDDTFAGTTGSAVGENIVMLRAFYGKDSTSSGTVDTWDQTSPTTSAGWAQVKAVRFAIVARSHQRDAALVSPESLKLWPDAGATTGPTMALTSEQRHYRYKIFDSLVPLRNQIWRP